MVWIFFFFGAFALYRGGTHLITLVLRRVVTRAAQGAPRRLGAVAWQLTWLCLAVLVIACLTSVLLLGNPIYGLGMLLFIPFLLPGWVRWQADRQVAALDSSAITFFHALRGLVQAGLGLPYAFFRLAEAVPTPFSEALRPHLARFDDGRSLETCLQRFRDRMDLQATGICLSILQMAYREGLPVAPFLERILPLLEADRAGRERVSSLRRSVAVQATVAFATPWFLAWVLASFQPDLARHFWNGQAAAIVGVALLCEGLGVWVLWKLSMFC